MAATTTPSTRSLIKALRSDFADIRFTEGDTSAWNPDQSTVFYEKITSPSQLLHELGHAILGHESYQRDVSLLRMEREAWSKAQELAPSYKVNISQDDVEDHLDSYREWLHTRSLCPTCEANGIQTDRQHFRCIECKALWRVNDARTCGLRRYLK